MHLYRFLAIHFGLLVAAVTLATDQTARGDNFSILHTFTQTSSPPDGGTSYSGLTLVGSTLYGGTIWGGSSGAGVVYSINPDGSGYTVLHSFSGADGFAAWGGLTAVGSTLYGTTLTGGTGIGGTVFSMNTDGSNEQVIYNFSNATGAPQGITTPVVVVGNEIYGMTSNANTSNGGVIYEVGTNGTGFKVLENLPGTGQNGTNFVSPLELSGSTLYGITQDGGANGKGFIFSVGTDGTGFKDIYYYTTQEGGPGSASPGLAIIGSTIYFNAHFALSAMNTDGSDFHVVSDYPTNGGYVPNEFSAFNGTLYVSMWGGGINNDGTVLSYDPDNNLFHLLHTFSGTDGNNPESPLTLVGSTLYGTTNAGGTDGYGVVFAIATPEPTSFVLTAIALPALWLLAARKRAATRGDRSRHLPVSPAIV
jgi:uncharacterized repeat protein (TIGR03803 family)